MSKLVFETQHNTNNNEVIHLVKDAEDERIVVGSLELNSENIFEFKANGMLSSEMLKEIANKLIDLNSVINVERLIQRTNKTLQTIQLSLLSGNIGVSTIDRPLDILGIFYLSKDQQRRFKSLASIDFSQDLLHDLYFAGYILNNGLSED